MANLAQNKAIHAGGKLSRKDALHHIKIATSQGDHQRATRLYVEHRISYDSFKKAVREGHALNSTSKREDSLGRRN